MDEMPGPIPIRKRRRTLRVALPVIALLIVAAVAAYVWPTAFAGRQDECAFGPVSNVQYRQALEQAQRFQRSEWGTLPLDRDVGSADGHEVRDELVKRIKIIESALPHTVYGRIAAAHAVIRSVGGVYLTTMAENRDVPAPFEEARSMTIIGYRLDMNRFGYFRPIRRWISIAVGFPVADRYENLSISVHIPSFLYFHEYERSRYHEVCPAVPSTIPENAKLPD